MLIIASKYSVLQSFSSAGIISLIIFNELLHPLNSQSKPSRASANLGKKISAFSLSINNVSAAPQIPVLLIFAFTVTSIAFLTSASLSIYT